VQWLAGLATAVWISPRNLGRHFQRDTRARLGGAVSRRGIISLPICLALIRPGAALTRHTIAVAQMLFGALLIHLSGGRIETHFHVFALAGVPGILRGTGRCWCRRPRLLPWTTFLRGMFCGRSRFLRRGRRQQLALAGARRPGCCSKTCSSFVPVFKAFKRCGLIASAQCAAGIPPAPGPETEVVARTTELRESEDRFRLIV